MNVRICQGPRVDGFSHVTILVFAASQKGEKSKSRNSRDCTFLSVFLGLRACPKTTFLYIFYIMNAPLPILQDIFTKHPSSVTFSRCPSGTAWSRHCRAALCSTWLATRKNMKIHMTGAKNVQRNGLFCWWHSIRMLGTWCWKCLPSGQLT